MAAWLAYLKSRLILPQEKSPEGEPSADEMATRLRWRLQRLDAMRAAATRLMGRERLDRDVFGRGDPEPVNVVKLRTLQGDSLYDLLTAYATERVRRLGGTVSLPSRSSPRCCRSRKPASGWNACWARFPTGAGWPPSCRWNGGSGARRRSAHGFDPAGLSGTGPGRQAGTRLQRAPFEGNICAGARPTPAPTWKTKSGSL